MYSLFSILHAKICQLNFGTSKMVVLELGGAKVKSVCGAKLAEFGKMSSISSIFTKTFWMIFLVKDLTNRILFSSDHSFWEHIFWARMWCLKNGWPLSVPPMAYFYHPQHIGNNVRKWRLMSAFTKKRFEKFWWKLKEHKPCPYSMGRIPPPSAYFRVNYLKTISNFEKKQVNKPQNWTIDCLNPFLDSLCNSALKNIGLPPAPKNDFSTLKTQCISRSLLKSLIWADS